METIEFRQAVMDRLVEIAKGDRITSNEAQWLGKARDIMQADGELIKEYQKVTRQIVDIINSSDL